MKTIKNISLMKNVQYIILSALLMVCGNVMGADAYKTLTFPDDNNSNNHVQNYTSTWTAKMGMDEWSISNFNNSNWTSWTYIRCGRDGNASVAAIVSPQMAVKIETITLTIDAITDNKVNSIKLYTSTNKSSWTEVGTYSKATGEQSVTIASNQQAANLYYKAEFDCASGSSNGLVQISKVEYFEVQAVCENPITITKGATSYGTFNLSNTGEQCGDGDGVTCQLTNITPNQNWYADHVETTSGNASPIVDGSATVSGIKESTTITVVFLEKEKATLKLSDAGNITTLTTGTEYQGDQVTLPSTASEHDGYILVGWSETPIINATAQPTNIYSKGATYTLTKKDQTLYAVFGKGTEGNNDVIWSENFGDQLTDNESFRADYTGFSGKGSLTYAGSGINLSKKTGGKVGCAVHTKNQGTGTFTVSGLNTSGYESFVLSYWVNASGTTDDFYHSVKVDNDNSKVYNTETTPATTQNYQEFTCTQIPAKEGLSLQFSFGVGNVSGSHLDEITLIGKNPDNITEWTTNFITYQNFAYKCTYEITYTLGDGHTWIDGYTAPAFYDHNKNGEAITLPTGDNLADGKYFRGWYNNKGLEGDAITELAVSGNGDTTFYAAWASVVNFHVRGEIATTQMINNDGKVTGYTPIATCTGKKFMGWSTVNQTELIQDPSSLDLFTDFSDKVFTASTDLYAVYASVNGGKVTGEQTLVDDISTVGSTICPNATYSLDKNAKCEGGTINNIYYYGFKLDATKDSAYFTTTKIKDLDSISFDYITNGSAISYYVMISTDGEEWTKVTKDNVTLSSNKDNTHTIPVLKFPQGDYYVKVGVTYKSTTNYYAIITKMTYYTADRSYWYSDYSTSCTMAKSATINYNNVYSYVASPIGETITISNYDAKNGYQVNSLTIQGVTYNVGDKYILAHDVTPEAADIRPVMTWTERYASTWSQPTTPDENGKLVLPETQPASFAPGLYEFDGWTTEIFSTETETKTVAPTYVSAETDAPATPTTYYAVYKKVGVSVYRQTTPTNLHTITYHTNGGTGNDYVVYTDVTTSTTPTAAQAGFVKEGATLVGWTLDPNADEIVYVAPNTTLSNIDGNRHYYAVWIGKLEMNKTIALTSASGATVGSASFTLSSKNLGTITALRFSYRDVNNDITYSPSNRSNSEFRLCNELYNIDENNLDVSTISTNFSHTYTITYAPNSGNKMSHYKLVVELLNKNKVMATQEFDLLGRALPNKFVIATQKDDQWYALQANMTDSKGWAGVPIDVEDGLAFASDTLLYSLRTYNNDKSHVLFQSAYKQGHLWAASGTETGIRNYATTISGENNSYAWLLTSENDLLSYTIRNKQDKTDHQYLGMNGTNMGMYQLITPMQFYFLPLGWKDTIKIASDSTLHAFAEYNLSQTDVVVKPNGTLTIDKSVTVRDVTVETGGKLNITNETFTINRLHLEGGWDEEHTSYDIPYVYIAPEASLVKTKDSVNLDMRVDKTNYYPFAVPFPVKVSDVDYVDATLAAASTYGKHFVIKTYDGARRADNGMDKENNWVAVPADATLQPGVGYILTAVTVDNYDKRLRFPMTFSNDWTANGEQGEVAEVVKNKPQIYQYESGIHPCHSGWNMVAVPFMSAYGDGENTTLGDVNYVTIPTHDFSEYKQVEVADTILRPEWSFFVQVENEGTLNFLTEQERLLTSPLMAPQRVDEVPEYAVAMRLSGSTTSDKTTLKVSDRYTTDYEIGADLEKMFGNAYTLATYTLMNGTRLAFNALDTEHAGQPIAVGYRVPETGDYTFSAVEKSDLSNVAHLYLTDYETGITTDLLNSGYTFTSARTQEDGRFVLNVQMRAPETPTALDEALKNAEAGTQKVVYQGKLFIIDKGVVYDGQGKRVMMK